MEETYKIVITSAFTIAGALIIFSIERIFELLWIKPYQRFKTELGKTREAVLFYNNLFTDTDYKNKKKSLYFKELEDSKKEIRKRYSCLFSSWSILKNTSISHFIKIPDEKEIEGMSLDLVFLSKISSPQNIQTSEQGKRILRLTKTLTKY